MSTGQIMPKGKFILSDYEIFVLGLGYSPSNVVQFNVLMFPPWYPLDRGKDGFWIAGGKLQTLPPRGTFQGISIGADYMSFPSFESDIRPAGASVGSSSTFQRWLSTNVAGSIGSRSMKIHLNYAHVWQTAPSTSSSFLFQAGAEFLLVSKNDDDGLEAMAETWFAPGSREQFRFTTLIVGLRAWAIGAAIDLGWPFFSDEGEPMRIYPVPYACVNYIL